MKNFQYINPTSIKEASNLMISFGESALLYAGGTDALSLLKNDVYTHSKVINLKKIGGLNSITHNKTSGIRIGSLTTISEIAKDETIKSEYKILHEAANEIASPQLRNIGTLGGNLCQSPRCWYYREDFDCIRKGGGECYAYEGRNKFHCVVGGGPCYIVHPSDMAVALLALDAKVIIFSEVGERTIPINELYVLPSENSSQETILKPGEIIKEILVAPPGQNTRSSYIKFKERGAWDFASVSVGLVLEIDAAKSIIEGKAAFGGVAPRPWTDDKFNKKLSGLALNETSVSEALNSLLNDSETLSENAYKLPLVKNLTKRSILNLA